MADRYISEKALIDNIAKIGDLRTLSTKTIGEAISKTPTADVEEVKHGKWLKNRNMYECSNCSYTFFANGPAGFNYCTGCGAKMDGRIKKGLEEERIVTWRRRENVMGITSGFVRGAQE